LPVLGLVDLPLLESGKTSDGFNTGLNPERLMFETDETRGYFSDVDDLEIE
jgi:hypothetical protein